MRNLVPVCLLTLYLCLVLFFSFLGDFRFLSFALKLYDEVLGVVFSSLFVLGTCWAFFQSGKSCPSVLEDVGGTISVVILFPLVSIFFSLLFLKFLLFDCWASWTNHTIFCSLLLVLSLRIMLSRFIYVVECVSTSSLFMAE